MDKHQKEALDRWLTTEPEWRTMSNTEDAFADACMEIVAKVDAKLQEPGNEEALEFWKEGDFDGAYDYLIKFFPEVTEEEWNWIEEFLSDI